MPIVSLGGVDQAGGVLIPGRQTFVRCDGVLVVVVGDMVTSHGQAPHDSPTVAAGSPTFRINGIPVARAGDPATCGDLCTGSATMSADGR
jgi:uncharacterized Zn-binding protein involved in type VI secretion